MLVSRSARTASVLEVAEWMFARLPAGIYPFELSACMPIHIRLLLCRAHGSMDGFHQIDGLLISRFNENCPPYSHQTAGNIVIIRIQVITKSWRLQYFIGINESLHCLRTPMVRPTRHEFTKLPNSSNSTMNAKLLQSRCGSGAKVKKNSHNYRSYCARTRKK